ncbi:MAG: MFS transporter [Rhodococcus sp. (in: high G+C Gram-positive bacteria)]
MVGTMVEWYDYFVYGTASALVFNKVFFSNLSPVAGVLASFATFGVAFVARPIGAVVFGHFGDRIGRKRMLVTSLMIMGVGTIAVGLLPTYEQVGLLAPALLVVCRLMQGFAVGGEWGGAVLMAVEHAPEGKRAFYGSWPQIGNPVAMVLATLTFIAVDASLTDEQFLSWGWRLPFIASTVLIGVGMYVRLRVMESPAFAAMQKSGNHARVPIGEVFRDHWRSVIVGIAVTAAPNIPYYIGTVFIINYAKELTELSGTTILLAICIASVGSAICIPLAATLADKYGRVRLLIIGASFIAVFAFPFFWLVNTGNLALIVFALLVLVGVGWGFTYSIQAGFFSELFPTHVRYTGTSVAYHLGGLITSGPVPLVATALVAWAGSSVPLSLYMVVGAGVAIFALATLGRRITFNIVEEKVTK